MSVKSSSLALFGRLFRSFVKPYWPFLLIALVFVLIDGWTIVGYAWGSKFLVDSFVDVAKVGADQTNSGMADLTTITFYTLMGAGLFAVRGSAAFIHRSILKIVGLRVIGDIQDRLMAHLLKLDVAFFNKLPPGEMIERVRGDSQALQAASTSVLMVLGRDTATALGALFYILYIDWTWALAGLAGVPIIVLPIVLLQQMIRRASFSSRTAAADLTQVMDEIFHGHKSVRLNQQEAHEKARSSGFIQKLIRKQSTSEIGAAALPSMIDILAGLGIAGILLVGMPQVASGEKSLGEFVSFLVAIGLLFDPIRRLASVAGMVQAAAASLDRIFWMLDAKPTIVNKPDAVQFKNAQADIRFNNVSFGYDANKPPVLKGLSFIAEAGKTTAFVGASGSGKSTLFQMICRFYDPSSGSITIGGQNLFDLDLASLRNHIGMVSQETALFNESLDYNIRYGYTSGEDSVVDLEQACRRANVGSFAKDLSIPAGPRGENLSGGQRQRIVIARALMRDAPILLLDEATSALDSETERSIQDALVEASAGRTTLVIAHRLSTIQNADMIHVMDDGQVIESGSHASLLALGGAYTKLARELSDD